MGLEDSAHPTNAKLKMLRNTMDFELNPDQQALQKAVIEFARKE
jgi:hypothetical protein